MVTKYDENRIEMIPDTDAQSVIRQSLLTELGRVCTADQLAQLLVGVREQKREANQRDLELAASLGVPFKLVSSGRTPKNVPELLAYPAKLADLRNQKNLASYELVPTPIDYELPQSEQNDENLLMQYERLARASLTVLAETNILPDLVNWNDILRQITMSLIVNKSVNLTCFACPSLEPEYLSGEDKDLFVSTNSFGSNILPKVVQMRRIIEALEEIAIPWGLSVTLADTDETEYIFPVIGVPENMALDVVRCRYEEQSGDLDTRLKSRLGRRVNVSTWSQVNERTLPKFIPEQTTSTSVYAEVSSQTLRFFDQSTLDLEIEMMRNIFGDSWYRGMLGNPKEEELRNIVRLKFATYAMQGLAIAARYPYSVLLQFESPPLLRTQMLNAYTQSIPELNINLALPAIYL